MYDIGEKMKARIIEHRGADVAKVEDSHWEHTVLRFESGDFCDVMIPYRFRYYKRKKNGELEQRQTNADSSVAMSFCPFCGTKFKGKQPAQSAPVSSHPVA